MKMKETSRDQDKKLDGNNKQDKGVVSKVIPHEEMPKLSDFGGFGDIINEDSMINTNIDVILNPLGGRTLN